jgi:galactose mutarotase-like enzyme
MTTDTLTIASDDLAVTVSASGAETQSICDRTGREFLWQGDPAHWSGRAPVLFPIVGAAPGGRIVVDGHAAGMAQHGFARRSRFAVDEHGPGHCRHRLVASAASRAVWPFEFRLDISHALDGPALTVTAEVHNDDRRTMPFGFGFHPAFAWPLPGAEGRPHLVVLDNGAAPGLRRIDADGLLTDTDHPSPFRAGELALDPGLFAGGALIFPEGAGCGLSYGAEGGPVLHFTFSGLPNLALWTRPGAPFLCVEPWHGMAARAGAGPDVADRPFTRHLPPGEVARFAFTVRFP